MLPSAVNDTMRDMMAQIRDVGDGIRNATYPFTAGTVSAPSISTTGDSNTGIYFPAADTIAFTEGGTEVMRVASSGKIGIGDTNPTYKLSVADTGADHQLWVRNTGTTASDDAIILVQTSSTGTTSTISGLYFGDGDSTSVGRLNYNHNDNSMALFTNSTEKIRITSGGLVGINTETPSAALDVNGNTFTNGYFRATGDGTEASPSIQPGNDADTGFFRPATNVIGFTTAGSEAMRILADGTLLVGTTTDGGVAGLSVRPNESVGAPQLNFNRNTSTSTSTVLIFRNATTAVGNINHNNTATTYATSSDYRLKENIAPMTGALNKISQLKPVTYKWKIDGSDGQGFIAHELQEVVPECVSGEKDALDSEGNPEYQGIDTSFLVATLTAAIQELKATVDAQAARITALEGAA
jgi:hypothetical protein